MTKMRDHGELKIITCNIPLEHLKYVQKLMDWGLTPSRSEYVRRAIANQIRIDLETKKYVKETIDADEQKEENMIRVPEGYDYIEGFNGNKPFKTKRLEY